MLVFPCQGLDLRTVRLHRRLQELQATVGSGQHRLCLEHTFDRHDDIEVINTIELRNVINPWTYQHLKGFGTLTGFYLPFPENGLVLSSDHITRMWARLLAQCQRDKYRRHPRYRGLDSLLGPALMEEAHHCLLEKFGLWLGSQVCS